MTTTRISRIYWWLLGVTGLAFLLRIPTLAGQSLWRDEVDAIIFSSWPLRELVAGLVREGHNGPLYFLLLRPWRTLLGDSEFALRYPSALLGVIAVPLGYVLARQLGLKRPVGLLLSLLLATSPYLIWYGQEAKMYTLLLALILLASIAYLKALTAAPLPPPWQHRPAKGWWWAIFTLAMTIAFYTHILAPLMLLVYGLIALIYLPHWREHWRGWLISMGCLTLPYLPLAAWQLPILIRGYVSGHPFYTLSDTVTILLQLYSGGLIRFAPADLVIHLLPAWGASLAAPLQQSWMWLVALVLFLFLGLCGLLLQRPDGNPSNQPRWRERLTLLTWLVMPPLVVYLISLRVAVFEDRYLIYISPAFYLLVALGLYVIGRRLRWLAILCLCLVLSVNALGIWQQQRQPIKADFRAATEYLASQPTPPQAIMVQMPYLQRTLNYYYPHEYTLLEGLWTNNGKDPDAVHAEMLTLTAEHEEIWLVVSEERLWDQRGLTRAWLDENASLISEANFVRVDVYQYRLPPRIIGESVEAEE